ncbi:MAG: hypothetical protein HYY92_00040 [Parcubacteria group bacterium]|nr:hypothetical protein [Parcubacteria group bacterium]
MTTTGMHVNHPCNPNMGILGNVINVAMRDVGAGEELTADYAMVYSHPSFRLECHCGAENCRKIITGDDWKKKELQEKYRGFFSAYIQKKINKANEVKIEV